jgi:hypothetical protein
MITRTPLARRVIAALLMVLLTACQTWRPMRVRPPQTYIPAEQPSTVRATLRTGTTVTLETPTVRGDSIFGITDAGVVGVASEDVYLLEVRRLSILRSIGLVHLVAGALIVVVIVACLVEGEDDCLVPTDPS